jgi:hypothetical protein
VYLIGYLGIFSLKNKDNLKKFAAAYKKRNRTRKNPTAEEIDKKDKNNFVSFLTQRLEEAGKICSQKNRNIRGTDGVYEAFIGDARADVTDEALTVRPEAYGYRKLKKKELETLAASSNVEPKGQFVTPDNKIVRVVEIGPKPLRAEDISDVYSPDNAFSMNPLTFMEAVEEEANDTMLKRRFDSMLLPEKTSKLERFIDRYADNPRYHEEVRLAKRMVREISG